MVDAAPTLRTPRTVLRAYRLEDFEALAAVRADPAVMGHIAGGPASREESWSRFVRDIGMWRLMGFGYWAVTEKVSGVYLGHVGFQDLRRELAPSIEGTLEAGWLITAKAQGGGIATEAMQAALEWADATFPGRQVTCFIDHGNAASIRVAAKLGFEPFAEANYKGTPVTLFESVSPYRSN